MTNPRYCFSPLVKLEEPEVVSFTGAQGYHEAIGVTQCSRSKPVMPENYAKLIVNKSRLKQHCRSGVEPTTRKRMWLDVVGVNDADSVLLVKAFGEPKDDLDEDVVASGVEGNMGLRTGLSNFPSFHLRLASFTPGLERVLNAIFRKFSHKESEVHSPLVPLLAHLMLHFIDEWEVFALLSHLLSRTAWLDQTPFQITASKHTLLSLLQSHGRSTLIALKHLKPQGVSQQVFMDHLTDNWFLWPFFQQSFWISIRILDLFIVEGPKIFYRLALSSLKLFASLSQSPLELVSLRSAVQEFMCSLSSKQKARWFREAFSIPHLSWLYILKEWHSHLPAAAPNEVDGADQDSIESLRESDDNLVVPDPSSELIQSPETWFKIWSWLPDWVTCTEPQCVFRASRDGYNLRTLYRKCEEYPCILLLIKSTNDREFGSFIATELSERHNNQFFGTGESFVFSLSPDVHCYKWTAETDLILRANDHELIIGSGGGTYGLWLDSDLNQGSSGPCAAFNNPPLGGPQSQFKCTSIEVYSCS